MKVRIGPFSIGLCLYERCIYYEVCKHPKTGHCCAFGHPSCRLGKLDLFISTYLIGFGLAVTHKAKCVVCRIYGHEPYHIKNKGKKKLDIVICRRCGRKL